MYDQYNVMLCKSPEFAFKLSRRGLNAIIIIIIIISRQNNDRTVQKKKHYIKQQQHGRVGSIAHCPFGTESLTLV